MDKKLCSPHPRQPLHHSYAKCTTVKIPTYRRRQRDGQTNNEGSRKADRQGDRPTDRHIDMYGHLPTQKKGPELENLAKLNVLCLNMQVLLESFRGHVHDAPSI